MKDKAFLDTNIFVYAYDIRDPSKQAKAAMLISGLARSGSGVVSSQVGQELLANLTRKLKLRPSESKLHIASLRDHEFVPMTIDLLLEAQVLMEMLSVSVWDAMILAAAKSAGCKTVHTEDLQHGQIILGMRIENPFV